MRKKPGVNDQEGPVLGLVGEGIELEGNLVFPQTLRLDGRITGTIKRYDKLIVGEKGKIEGDIEVNSLICYGKVEGTIRVKNRLVIKAKGRVQGEVFLHGPTLVVEEGGILDGSISLSDSGSPKIVPGSGKKVEPISQKARQR